MQDILCTCTDTRHQLTPVSCNINSIGRGTSQAANVGILSIEIYLNTARTMSLSTQIIDRFKDSLHINLSNSEVCPTLTSVQLTRLSNSQVCPTHTSVQLSRQSNSHVCLIHTSVQLKRLSNSHVCPTHTSVQLTSLSNSHVCPTLTSVQLTRLSNSQVCPTHKSV